MVLVIMIGFAIPEGTGLKERGDRLIINGIENAGFIIPSRFRFAYGRFYLSHPALALGSKIIPSSFKAGVLIEAGTGGR